MKLITSASIALLTVAALAAVPMSANATPVSQAATAAKPTDSQLADKINAKINADASLKKFDIDASVDAGVATLKGTVATVAQKTRAERDARMTGITRIDNKITVDASAGKGPGAQTKDAVEKAGAKTKDAVETAGSKTKDAAETAGAKTKEAAKTAGEKTKEGVQTAAEKTKEGAQTAAAKTKEGVSKTGEAITDAWITTKIKTDFVGEDLLKGSDINVDTNNHTVTLKGTVKTQAGRERAVAIAKKTDGVTRVVDQLAIK